MNERSASGKMAAPMESNAVRTMLLKILRFSRVLNRYRIGCAGSRFLSRKSYAGTVLLPKTSFPQRLSGAKTSQRDDDIAKVVYRRCIGFCFGTDDANAGIFLYYHRDAPNSLLMECDFNCKMATLKAMFRGSATKDVIFLSSISSLMQLRSH